MGCGTSKSHNSIIEPQKKERQTEERIKKNSRDERNLLIKDTLIGQEQEDEIQENQIPEEHRKDSIALPKRLGIVKNDQNQNKQTQSEVGAVEPEKQKNNINSNWKGPFHHETQEVFTTSDQHGEKQKKQTYELPKLESSKNDSPQLKENIEDLLQQSSLSIKTKPICEQDFSEYRRPDSININNINSNLEKCEDYFLKSQQISPNTLDHPRIPANPKTLNQSTIINCDFFYPNTSNASNPNLNESRPFTERHQISSIMMSDSAVQLSQLFQQHQQQQSDPQLQFFSNQSKSRHILPVKEEANYKNDGKQQISRIYIQTPLEQSQNSQKKEGNSLHENSKQVSQFLPQSSQNLQNSIKDTYPTYCETYNKIFKSSLKQQRFRKDIPFLIENAVKHHNLDCQQTANLERVHKILLRCNQCIDRLVAVICFGFILNVKEISHGNTKNNVDNTHKKCSHSIKAMFFSQRTGESITLEEKIQKEINSMERIKGYLGLVTMKSYSVETIDLKDQRTGVLIITLNEEVNGTLKDFRLMCEERTSRNISDSQSHIIFPGNDFLKCSQTNLQGDQKNNSNGYLRMNERSIVKKSKEMVCALKSVFNASCYNYSLAETVILICSSKDSLLLCDFGAQVLSLTYEYIYRQITQNLVLQSPQIRVMLSNLAEDENLFSQSPFLTSDSNQIYAAGVSLALLAGIQESSLINYAQSSLKPSVEINNSHENLNNQNDVFTHPSYSTRLAAYRANLMQSLFLDSLPQHSILFEKSHLIVNYLLAQSLNLSVFPVIESKDNDINYILMQFLNIDEEERNIEELINISEVLSSKYFIDYPISRIEREYVKGPVQSKAPEVSMFVELKKKETNKNTVISGQKQQDADFHLQMALGYYEIDKNYEAALDHILKALKFNQGGNSGEYLNSLGCILIQINNFEQALKALNLAIQQYPSYALPYFNIGFIKHKVERAPKTAMELYQHSLDLDENLIESVFNMAVIQKNYLNQVNSARNNYTFCSKVFPKDSQVDNNIGVLEREN